MPKRDHSSLREQRKLVKLRRKEKTLREEAEKE